jgi:hypothetical protein
LGVVIASFPAVAHETVGTTKKSEETISFIWFARNVRQVARESQFQQFAMHARRSRTVIGLAHLANAGDYFGR